MSKDWKTKLHKLQNDALDYYSKCKISPCGEEILDYVVDMIEKDSGCDVDNEQYASIAKILGIKLDANR